MRLENIFPLFNSDLTRNYLNGSIPSSLSQLSHKFVSVVFRAAINNREKKFREKIKERNTRFTWFDKLSTSTGERAAVIIILIS